MNKRLVAVQDSHSVTYWYDDGSKETNTQLFRKYGIVQYSLCDVIPASQEETVRAFDEMKDWLKAQDFGE